jgi:hypothetical protein
MDAEIRKVEKLVSKHKNKKAGKELKVLEKADKKRDGLVDLGKKAKKMKGKC